MPSIKSAAVVVLLLSGAAGAAAQTPPGDRTRIDLQIATGEAVAPPLTVAAAPTTVKPARPSGRLYRIHVTMPDPAAAGWTIEIADGSRKWSSGPLDPAAGEWWSPELENHPASATIKLTGPAGQAPPRVLVDRLAILDQRPNPQATTPPHDDSASITTGSPRIKRWGKSVARLQYSDAAGNGFFCTAFLVSPSIMLTNNHCINTDAEMRSAIAEFDFDKAGAKVETRKFTALLVHDEGLDYALVRLETPSTRAPLPLKDAAVTDLQGLIVIEHPAGKPKRFSLIDCQVRGVDMPGLGTVNTDFGHFCDTEGGSSGSPIQDALSGNVIGLHHLGFTTGDAVSVNRAVRIGLILNDLATRAPAVRAEITQP